MRFVKEWLFSALITVFVFEVLNARGKLKLGKKMLDYIINQSGDEKRVVDVVHVEH